MIWPLLSCVKINKGKPHYNGVRRPERRALSPTPLCQYLLQQEGMYLASPAKSGPTASWRKKEFSLPGNSSASERLLQLPSKKPLYFQLAVSSNGLFVYILFCFTRLACGSLYLHISNCNSLLFPTITIWMESSWVFCFRLNLLRGLRRKSYPAEKGG